MMVAKTKKKELSDDEVDEIMNEKSDHSTHLRSRNYDKDCYYCVAHGYITPESPSEE